MADPFPGKRTHTEGASARIQLLTHHYPRTPELIVLFHNRYSGSRSMIDDLLDALVLAVTGAAGLRSGFYFLPQDVNEDVRGIRMQIVTAGKL